MRTESGAPAETDAAAETGAPAETAAVSPAMPAGWYPDPNTGVQRWWNGSEWGRFAAGQTQTQGTNGLAIASLPLGIIGLILYPFFVCAVLATIFGAIGMKQARERSQGGRGLGIAGLVLGIIGIVAGVAIWIAVAVSVNTSYY